MTNSELFELVVVMIEIGVFTMILSVGAVVLEVMYPKLVKLMKRIAVRAKIRKLKRHIMSGIKAQSG